MKNEKDLLTKLMLQKIYYLPFLTESYKYYKVKDFVLYNNFVYNF